MSVVVFDANLWWLYVCYDDRPSGVYSGIYGGMGIPDLEVFNTLFWRYLASYLIAVPKKARKRKLHSQQQ